MFSRRKFGLLPKSSADSISLLCLSSQRFDDRSSSASDVITRISKSSLAKPARARARARHSFCRLGGCARRIIEVINFTGDTVYTCHVCAKPGAYRSKNNQSSPGTREVSRIRRSPLPVRPKAERPPLSLAESIAPFSSIGVIRSCPYSYSGQHRSTGYARCVFRYCLEVLRLASPT